MVIPQPRPIILVTGANGQLGQEFRYLAEQQEVFEFLFTTRATLDISDKEDISLILSKWQPQYVINCAAYTAVDKAEEEIDKAYEINRDGVGTLAKACLQFECKLVHISTDYVYDSITDRPILSSDDCTPKSIYGKSKLGGEEAIAQVGCEHIILRVSWLYSSYAENFVKTMLRLGTERDNLTIVSDQIGAPTYARDLANAIVEIIKEDQSKSLTWKSTYNFSNQGQTNWAEFAEEIFAKANITCEVGKTTTEAYGARAPRPRWSVMDITPIKRDFGIEILSWQDALSNCLSVINGQ